MSTGTYRRNEYDVTDRIDTTDSSAVLSEVCRIYQDLYQRDNAGNILQAFDDLTRLYRGEYPGYHACDTSYHNIQHVLDVTLAMARLMDGAARTTAEVLDERLFRFGIVTALYHDCGYIRHRKDTRHANGAEYTKTHVSRGGKLITHGQILGFLQQRTAPFERRGVALLLEFRAQLAIHPGAA